MVSQVWPGFVQPCNSIRAISTGHCTGAYNDRSQYQTFCIVNAYTYRSPYQTLQRGCVHQ
eukprot:555226-Rhodomonas_salina.1